MGKTRDLFKKIRDTKRTFHAKIGSKKDRNGIPNSFRIFQFIVIHTVKSFNIVNKAEIDVFLELSCFFNDQRMLAILFLVPLPLLKPA